LAGKTTQASETISKKDLNGLENRTENTGKNYILGILLNGEKDVVPFGKILWAWPMRILWQLPST